MPLAIKLQTSSQMGQPLFWKEGKLFKVSFFITASGNYPAGGDTLDLTALFGVLSSAPGLSLPSFELPMDVDIKSWRPAGGANSGNLFLYQFCPGTTLANGTMQVLTGAAAQTALTEFTAGAYPAGVTTDTIKAIASFVMP
jgi:hypothetical protein